MTVSLKMSHRKYEIVSVSDLLGFSFEVVNLKEHQPNYK